MITDRDFAALAELHSHAIAEPAVEPLAAAAEITDREFEMVNAIELGNLRFHGESFDRRVVLQR